MSVVSIKVVGADQVKALAGRVREFTAEVPRVVDRTLEAILANAAGHARELAPAAFGSLRQGIGYLVFRGEGAGVLYSQQAYSSYVHGDGASYYARQPGSAMPPKDALVPWIRLKLRAKAAEAKKAAGKKVAFSRKQASALNDEAERIAFVVARAIQRKGIVARPFLKEALDQQEPLLEPALEAELQAAAERVFGR